MAKKPAKKSKSKGVNKTERQKVEAARGVPNRSGKVSYMKDREAKATTPEKPGG